MNSIPDSRDGRESPESSLTVLQGNDQIREIPASPPWNISGLAQSFPRMSKDCKTKTSAKKSVLV